MSGLLGLLLLPLFLLNADVLIAQTGVGVPVIRNFTPKEYRAEVRNWSMVQDKRGVMFIGNNAGVLKYDGNHWRLISINNTIARALAIDSNDKVYVGTQGEIGYLEADKQGKLGYVSLLPLLSTEDRDFTDVWSAHVTNDTVYFHTAFKLIRIVGSQVTTWNTNYSYHRSFLLNNQLYLRQDGIGLTRLENEEFRPVAGGEIFKKEFISVMLALPDGRILIGSRNQGFYIYDPKATDSKRAITVFNNEAATYFSRHLIYTGTVFENGNYAIGTLTGGVVILNPEGKQVFIYDESAGVHNNTAYFVFSERRNNLVILGNGIAIIESHSPISVWSKGANLQGTVLSALWHQGTLYVSTSSGMFYLDKVKRRFNRIEGVTTQCWQLLHYGDGEYSSVLTTSTFGLFEITGDKYQVIDNGRSFSFQRHPENPEMIFVSQNGEVLAIQKERGKWLKKKIPVIKDKLFWSMAFDADQNLWLGSELHGVIKIKSDFIKDSIHKQDSIISHQFISQYDTAHGLPTLTKSYIFNIHNKLCVATTNGVYFYDKSTDRFVLEEEIFKSISNRRVYQLAQDSQGNVWFESSLGKGALRKIDNEWVLDDAALKRLPALPEYIANSSVIYTDTEGIVWFGTAEGLFRFDPAYPKKYNEPFNVLIRSVEMSDSVYFFGHGTLPEMTFSAGKNKLLVSFSAPFYEGGDYIQYSYRLEGFENQWSDWSYRTDKEYTNLSPGSYTFYVKARNVYGDESNTAKYVFTILTPWYYQWWMLITYALTASFFVYSFIRWRERSYIKEQERLERIIEEHTKEIKAQNEELIMYQEEILANRDSLQRQNKKLEDANKLIARSNQELESAVEKRTVELAEMNYQLSKQYRQLEQFSFVAAHNLRAPVARILGLISILDKRNLASPENVIILNKLYDSAKDLDVIIRDLGSIINVQKGQSLEYEHVDLIKLIENIKMQYEDDINKYSIQIDLHSRIEKIYTIPLYINSIMTNLISNAIKYHTDKYKPRIYIELLIANEEYKIIVEDNGIGFDSEKFADKLFEPFQRFHTHLDGKGLGMFLVKTQVDAMGGSIILQSKPGRGTKIEIVLPIKTEVFPVA